MDANQHNGHAVGSSVTLGAATEPKQELGTGTVNFEAGLVPNAQAQLDSVLDATPAPTVVGLGGVQTLGASPSQQDEVAAQEQESLSHLIDVEVDLTLNTGLTILQGRKELKSVDIEDAAGGKLRFNFYNPFVRADRDRQTGEGLLRKTFGSIATIVGAVLGREVVYLGSASDVEAEVSKLAKSVQDRLTKQFPIAADVELFEVELEAPDGGLFVRPLTFGELFSINMWCDDYEVEEACVVRHTVHFNIALNIGALYDSQEPQVFVRRAFQFLQTHLEAAGLAESINYHVNYAFAAQALENAADRETLDILTSEDGFYVISRSSVLDGSIPWIKPSDVDKLFGVGCDLILRSPEPLVEEEGAAEQAEA